MSEQKPVPYESGGDCLFYAVQAATMYFDNFPLTVDDRVEYIEEGQNRIRLLRAITGKDEVMAGEIMLSLQMILTKLRANQIYPTELLCVDGLDEIIEELHFVKRNEIPVKSVNSIQLSKLPGLIIITPNNRECEERSHVWFCSDSKDYIDNSLLHKSDSEGIVMVIPLERRTER